MGPCLAAMQMETTHYFHKGEYKPDFNDVSGNLLEGFADSNPLRRSSSPRLDHSHGASSSVLDRMRSSGRRRIGDEVSKEASPTNRRVSGIMTAWEVRGAKRPITSFYDRVCQLGSGAYGVVEKWQYKNTGARSAELDALMDDPFVAVKQIKWRHVWGGWNRNAEKESRIRKELRTLIHLDHPFIIRFREWFEDPCRGMFFITEMCQGPSLQAVLEEVCEDKTHASRNLNLRRCRRYFREVVYGVSYIHGLNPPVVHRDLKPENILLKTIDPSSPVKIIDFGLAELRLAELEKGDDMQAGTMVFMAPELFASKQTGRFTEEVDTWALGIIFTWIVTALDSGVLQHPFLEKNEGEGFNVAHMSLRRAFREKRKWDRKLFSAQPVGLGIAEGFLQYEPEKRTKAAVALQQEWLRSGDPAAAEAARLLAKGALRTNLATFARLPVIDKKILEYAAEYSSESDVALLRRTFKALDLDCDGRLSYEELVKGMEANDVAISGDVRRTFMEFSTDNQDMTINYQEWLAATIGPKVLESTTCVALAFHRFDISGNGFLSFEDLAAAIGEDEALLVCPERNNIERVEFQRLVDAVSDRRLPVRGSSTNSILRHGSSKFDVTKSEESGRRWRHMPNQLLSKVQEIKYRRTSYH